MVNLVGKPLWSDVRLLESHEYAQGGENGNMNEQAKALVNRTEYLRGLLKQLQEAQQNQLDWQTQFSEQISQLGQQIEQINLKLEQPSTPEQPSISCEGATPYLLISPDLQYEVGPLADAANNTEITWRMKVDGVDIGISASNNTSFLEDFANVLINYGLIIEFLNGKGILIYTKQEITRRLELIPDKKYLSQMDLIGNPSATILENRNIQFCLSGYMSPEAIKTEIVVASISCDGAIASAKILPDLQYGTTSLLASPSTGSDILYWDIEIDGIRYATRANSWNNQFIEGKINNLNNGLVAYYTKDRQLALYNTTDHNMRIQLIPSSNYTNVMVFDSDNISMLRDDSTGIVSMCLASNPEYVPASNQAVLQGVLGGIGSWWNGRFVTGERGNHLFNVSLAEGAMNPAGNASLSNFGMYFGTEDVNTYITNTAPEPRTLIFNWDSDNNTESMPSFNLAEGFDAPAYFEVTPTGFMVTLAAQPKTITNTGDAA